MLTFNMRLNGFLKRAVLTVWDKVLLFLNLLCFRYTSDHLDRNECFLQNCILTCNTDSFESVQLLEDRRSKTGIDLISIYTVYSLTKTLYSLIFSCTVDLFMYINFFFLYCVFDFYSRLLLMSVLEHLRGSQLFLFDCTICFGFVCFVLFSV